MTFLPIRRRAWIVPVALSLWGAWFATANSATHATESTAPPAHDGHSGVTTADDPAAPDAPAGPPPIGVLHDFSRPALSVPTSDWRKVNASVSGMSGMTAMPGMSDGGHDMAGHNSGAVNISPSSNRTGHAAHTGHTGHNMQGDSR